MAKSNPLICCVGNLLMMDEGFGPHMAKVLTERDEALKYVDEAHADQLMSMFRADEVCPPEGDERTPVLDAGTMGMGLVPWIRRHDRIIVIDIIDCKNPDIAPGSVFTLTPEQMAENTVMHSLHDLRIIDVIGNAALAGYETEWTCICVQAKCYEPQDFYIGLSDEVAAAVPVVLGALMEQLGA